MKYYNKLKKIWNKLKYLWYENRFEFIIFICVIFLLILAIFRIGKEGTWSSNYYYDKNSGKISSQKKKGAPRQSSGEIECRRVLRKIFNKPFNSVRPNFLNNPVTGGNHNLEIDCYDHNLRLGCEYQGKQHYIYIPFFHKNKEAFLNQKYRDDMKKRMCKENGINLIEVPYTVKVGDIESYIKKELINIDYLK